jgi:hypothetical protein
MPPCVDLRKVAILSHPEKLPESNRLTLDGLEPLLEQDGPKDGPVLSAETNDDRDQEMQDCPEGGPLVHEISADEAAVILGISVRAVLKRLKKGNLKGRKVATKFGEKWLVDSSQLPRTVHVELDQQDGPASQEEQAGFGPAFSGDRPEDGPQNQSSVGQLALAQSLSNQAELIATVLKQSQIIEQLTNDLRQKDQELRLLTDNQHKGIRWRRFWGWFVGRS